MAVIIYQKSAPDMSLVSISITSEGNVGNVTNVEEDALSFENDDIIHTLIGGDEFWGARPDKRKPKPHK